MASTLLPEISYPLIHSFIHFNRWFFHAAWPQHYFLKGHTGKVTTLLYPSDYSSAYDNNYLLSGGADFSVRLWDLYKGTLVHTFAVHGGDVKYIVTCPPEVNVSLYYYFT